eukprot:COSAG06_NODE_11116_length_1564_cov_6.099659_2_plen_47_part_01
MATAMEDGVASMRFQPESGSRSTSYVVAPAQLPSLMELHLMVPLVKA